MSEHAIAVGSAFPWHELYTSDQPAAIEFYGKVLGWTTQTMPMGEDMGGMEYTMFAKNGVPVCGVMSTVDNPQLSGVPTHWTLFTSVDDVDGAIATCEANGGSVQVPAMDIPTIGRMAMLVDPQGATFWVYKAEPQG